MAEWARTASEVLVGIRWGTVILACMGDITIVSNHGRSNQHELATISARGLKLAQVRERDGRRKQRLHLLWARHQPTIFLPPPGGPTLLPLQKENLLVNPFVGLNHCCDGKPFLNPLSAGCVFNRRHLFEGSHGPRHIGH